ncbi:hypothetical protein [Stenotrophomonas sp. YIM B13575]|uniref:hypothetical protein n=1 Tax=Stenotrophomonas sp. YIM B13575 TaxID=3366314 RepID=UPI00369EEB1B
MSDGLLNMLAGGQPLSVVQQHNLELYLGAYAQQNGTDAAIALVSGGIREASEFPYSGLSRDKQKFTDENFSFFEKNIWRADSENEAIFNKAVIRSGLEVWRSEDLLPTVMRQRRDFALMDALVGSPLASGSYLFGSLVGLSDDDRYALTMTAGNIALIAGATAAGKTGLLPVTGRFGINPVGEGGQKSSASSRRRVGESPRSDSVSVSTNSGTIKASETIGQPVEAVINGRKRMLRVDIEPNGKLQIQSGGGKDSFVDFRPDLSLPLAPQIDKAFRRLPKSARDQLVRNAEKGLRRLQETGNM